MLHEVSGPVPPAVPPSVDASRVPGLTACSLCAGETLEGRDPRPGGQLARLRALGEAGRARLTLVECLDRCERGDVLVVRPTSPGREQGGRPVWFDRLAGDALTGELGGWLDAGGPGLADVPDALAPFVAERGEPPV